MLTGERMSVLVLIRFSLTRMLSRLEDARLSTYVTFFSRERSVRLVDEGSTGSTRMNPEWRLPHACPEVGAAL